MSDPMSGPQPGDWFTATLRGLHPVRVVICLIGIGLSVLCLAVAQAVFAHDQIQLSGWLQQPIDQARTFRDEMAERTFFRAGIRILPLTTLLTSAWCVFGCWIARHELAARTRNRPYEAPPLLEPGPSSLVVQKFKSIILCCPMTLILLAISFLPIVFAGILNDWFGEVGALLVGVILPVVLITDLLILCLTLGFLAWPLMPMAIAAENSDTFDALSRCYNYAFTRPIRLAFFNALAIGLASIPILVVLYPLADVIAGLQPPGGQIAFWLAVALSASIFWSLQTLVYLHMRTAVDDVDANEIATGPDTSEPAESKPLASITEAAQKAVVSEPAKPGSVFKRNALGLIAVIASWCMTVWLFARLGGDDTGWMNWVLGEEVVPAAKGLYAAAALLALIWGVMWLGLPVYMTIATFFRRVAAEAQPDPPVSQAPTSP